jgi:hypothetical protein
MTLDNLEYLQVVAHRLALSFRGYMAELMESGRFLTNLSRFESQEWDIFPTNYPLIQPFSFVLTVHPLDENDKSLKTISEPVTNHLEHAAQRRRTTNLSSIAVETDKSDLGSLVRLVNGCRNLVKFALRTFTRNSPYGEDELDLISLLRSQSQSLRQLTFSTATHKLPLQCFEQQILIDLNIFNVLEVLRVPLEVLLGLDPDNPRPFHRVLPRSL